MKSTAFLYIAVLGLATVNTTACTTSSSHPAVGPMQRSTKQFPQYSSIIGMHQGRPLPKCALHSNQDIAGHGPNGGGGGGGGGNSALPKTHWYKAGPEAVAEHAPQPVMIPKEEMVYYPDPTAPDMPPPKGPPDAAPEPIILNQGNVYIHQGVMQNPYMPNNPPPDQGANGNGGNQGNPQGQGGQQENSPPPGPPPARGAFLRMPAPAAAQAQQEMPADPSPAPARTRGRASSRGSLIKASEECCLQDKIAFEEANAAKSAPKPVAKPAEEPPHFQGNNNNNNTNPANQPLVDKKAIYQRFHNW